MNCCLAPLKCVLFIINCVFWVCGGFLLYAGVRYVQSNDGSLVYASVWPAVVILSAGGVLIFGGIIGCIGTIMEKKSCLGVFMILLVLVLICEICVAALMLSSRMNARNSFDDFVLTQFQNYYNATDDSSFNQTSFIDTTQTALECCGYNNYTDWENETWASNHSFVPMSCCKTLNPSSNATNDTCTGNIMKPELIYTRGCKDQINKTFTIVYDFISWTSVSLSILVFIGIFIVLGLMYRQRNLPLGYSHLSPAYTEV